MFNTIIEIIGWIAASMTSVFLIPQIYSMFKSKDISDVSWMMLIISLCTPFFWIIYGLYVQSYQIVFTDSLVAVTAIIVISYKIYQVRRDLKINSKLENKEYVFNEINVNDATYDELLKIKEALEGGEA